jgi:hypothetical protein
MIGVGILYQNKIRKPGYWWFFFVYLIDSVQSFKRERERVRERDMRKCVISRIVWESLQLERERERERDTDTHTHTHRERERGRHTETDTERDR